MRYPGVQASRICGSMCTAARYACQGVCVCVYLLHVVCTRMCVYVRGSTCPMLSWKKPACKFQSHVLRNKGMASSGPASHSRGTRNMAHRGASCRAALQLFALRRHSKTSESERAGRRRRRCNAKREGDGDRAGMAGRRVNCRLRRAFCACVQQHAFSICKRETREVSAFYTKELKL